MGVQLAKPWFRLVFGLVLALAGLGSALTVLPGCAHTGTAVGDNRVYYAASEQLYTTTVRAVTALGQTGHLTLAQAEEFERYRERANALLDEWRAAVDRGEPTNLQASFDSLLRELARIQVQAQGGVK